jgi:hypothetical protein
MEGIQGAGSDDMAERVSGGGGEKDAARGEVSDLRPSACRWLDVISSSTVTDRGIDCRRALFVPAHGQPSKALCSELARLRLLPSACNSSGGVRATGLGCME